ncbi:FkbM family methyltransferase [Mycolicibacterium moriokaense]|nr:FkbM family methyltransferase [Mycolicibacterium moriokaense]
MTEMVKAKLNGEWEIVLPKHRADRPEWYTESGWEKRRLAAMFNTITSQQHPVVYYVGAEEGEMSALCQMWGAEVVLFEPNPKVWPNMKAIWEANGLQPPLASFDGFASNRTSNDALAHLKERQFPDYADGEVIGNHGFKELYLEANNYPYIRLDDVVSYRIPPPTIITFDCEGSDWQVMRGAEQTVRQYKPMIFASIHPEFMFHQWSEYSRDFRNWIIEFGYEETILDYQHELHTMYVPKAAV